MIEFTIRILSDNQKGVSAGFKLHPDVDAISEIEMSLLKTYLTPTALGVLEKLLEADGRLPRSTHQ